MASIGVEALQPKSRGPEYEHTVLVQQQGQSTPAVDFESSPLPGRPVRHARPQAAPAGEALDPELKPQQAQDGIW